MRSFNNIILTLKEWLEESKELNEKNFKESGCDKIMPLRIKITEKNDFIPIDWRIDREKWINKSTSVTSKWEKNDFKTWAGNQCSYRIVFEANKENDKNKESLLEGLNNIIEKMKI